MNKQSIFEYIRANGGAMNAYRTFVEEHGLAHPASPVAGVVEPLRARLAEARPIERHHLVVDHIASQIPVVHGFCPEYY